MDVRGVDPRSGDRSSGVMVPAFKNRFSFGSVLRKNRGFRFSLGFYLREIVSTVHAMATWLARWLDVTHRYCIKTAKHILKLFRPPGNPIILVSSDSCADTQFQGEPFSGGIKYTGWENWRFSTEIAVYLRNGVR